jgi:hypothetical protein
MGKKTKHTKKRSTRRKTLRRRKTRKGGGNSQALTMPDSSFGRFVGSPENSADSWYAESSKGK